MHNRFVVDSESTVREMVELAVTNWLSAQHFGANDHYRKELAILAERFLESAKEMQGCWTIASVCAGINDAKRTPPPISHAFADISGNVNDVD
jgi:hypothetical protein